MNFLPGFVGSLSELCKEFVEQGMLDRITHGIGIEVALRHVGRVLCVVDQYMVPGLVLGRTTSGVRLVPFLGPLKEGISVEDFSKLKRPKTPIKNTLSPIMCFCRTCRRISTTGLERGPIAFKIITERFVPRSFIASSYRSGDTPIAVSAHLIRQRSIQL